jgi:hypothetical protein
MSQNQSGYAIWHTTEVCDADATRLPTESDDGSLLPSSVRAQKKFMANKHTRKRPKVLGCTKPDGGKNQHKHKVNLASVNKYAGKKAKKAAALAAAKMMIGGDPIVTKKGKKFAY